MSYILDALKKSEQDRLQKENPGDAEINWVAVEAPQASSSLLPGLFIGISLVLVLALVFWVLTFWVLVPEQSSLPEFSPDGVDKSYQPVPVERAVVKPQIVKAAVPEPQKPAQAETEINNRQQPEVVQSTQIESLPEIEPAKAPAVTRSERVLPPLSVLRKIPDLIITGHIYSSIANKRSVSINGRDWNEGDYLSDTIRVKEITSDGVVMDVEGWSLPLKRNKGWQAIQ